MKQFRATTPDGGVALAAATVKTVIQVVAGANSADDIPWIEIAFDGTSAAAVPGQVRILRQTTAPGTPGTAPSIVELPNADLGALQTTVVTGGGTEPTASDVYHKSFRHPQGSYLIPGPFRVNAGDRLGVECNFAAVVNVHVTIPGNE